MPSIFFMNSSSLRPLVILSISWPIVNSKIQFITSYLHFSDQYYQEKLDMTTEKTYMDPEEWLKLLLYLAEHICIRLESFKDWVKVIQDFTETLLKLKKQSRIRSWSKTIMELHFGVNECLQAQL